MIANEDRFWSKINKNGPVVREDLGPCWEWTAAKRRGYGALKIDGRMRGAHRVAYELANGPIPEGMCI